MAGCSSALAKVASLIRYFHRSTSRCGYHLWRCRFGRRSVSAPPSANRSASSATSRRTASAKAFSLAGGMTIPVTPSVTVPPRSPTLVTMTGLANALAIAMTPLCEASTYGRTTMSASMNNWAVSVSGM